MGLGYVTVSVEVGLGDAIERLGKPMGLPQSLPPARVCEILPPEVALLLEAGGAGENSTEVPPSTVRRAMGEEPTGVGVPGGRTPGHGVMKRLGGVPPQIVSVWGLLQMFWQGSPLSCKTCKRGKGCTDWCPGWALTGSGRCAENVAMYPPPLYCVSGGA